MDIRAYNRDAWDPQVDKENVWTQPVSPEIRAELINGTITNRFPCTSRRHAASISLSGTRSTSARNFPSRINSQTMFVPSPIASGVSAGFGGTSAASIRSDQDTSRLCSSP